MKKFSHPSELAIIDYTYDLPDDKIAKFPLGQRDLSKLLIYQRGSITENSYSNIADFLPSDSLIIFNNSKVIQARIFFRKESGALIEIFCLEPAPEYREITTAMTSTGRTSWKCLIGGASKWKHGTVLEKTFRIDGRELSFQAAIKERLQDSFIVEFTWENDKISFAELLPLVGNIPLPPYIKRAADIKDLERYQTVYAHSEGSVAAPTAGLHFTEQILENLRAKKIATTFVTLHVGAGTFKPVKAATMQAHEMHAEFIDINIGTIDALLSFQSKFITAVGTTSLRTIESLYWIGAKIFRNPALAHDLLELDQWEPYEEGHSTISVQDALNALRAWLIHHNLDRLVTKTSLLIAPGYEFKLASALVTNFHQPQSTLLLLVAAFIGDDWRKVYTHALENDFRFLSYGDGCLLFRNQA